MWWFSAVRLAMNSSWFGHVAFISLSLSRVWASSGCTGRYMSIVSPVSAKLMGQDWSLFAAVSWRCVSPSITVVDSGFIMSVFVSVRWVISAVVVVFILVARLLDHSLQK